MVEPITATLVVLAAAGVAAGGTKTGRAAAGNAARAGYQATGWRTPGKAITHHSGRAGALAGRLTSRAARGTRALATRGAKATGRGATRAARAGTGRLAGRWADRTARGGATPRPLVTWPTRTTPDDSGTAPDVRGGTTPDAASRQTDPDARVDAAPDATAPARATTGGTQTGPTLGPPTTSTATSGAGDPPNAPPKTAPPSTTAAPATTPHARVRAERSSTVRNRYTINLEMPASDAEFLESCVHLGDVLKNIAEEIGEWANSLSGLNLPQSVIQPLDSISEGLVEAAGGASQAAKSFEDEFEDAREVASRGMTITGQDAA